MPRAVPRAVPLPCHSPTCTGSSPAPSLAGLGRERKEQIQLGLGSFSSKAFIKMCNMPTITIRHRQQALDTSKLKGGEGSMSLVGSCQNPPGLAQVALS